MTDVMLTAMTCGGCAGIGGIAGGIGGDDGGGSCGGRGDGGGAGGGKGGAMGRKVNEAAVLSAEMEITTSMCCPLARHVVSHSMPEPLPVTVRKTRYGKRPVSRSPDALTSKGMNDCSSLLSHSSTCKRRTSGRLRPTSRTVTLPAGSTMHCEAPGSLSYVLP